MQTTVNTELGLKTLMTLSDERAIGNPAILPQRRRKLATIQRTKKTSKRMRAIHAKIANRRQEFLHRERSSSKLAKTSMAKTSMAKTNMAKCVLDAGWSGLRNMSAHKAITRGGMCLHVNEAYASQTCPECASSAGPKGRAGPNKRTWTCRDCAAVHNRDLNAARNILRMGLHTLSKQPVLESRSLAAPAFRQGVVGVPRPVSLPLKSCASCPNFGGASWGESHG